MNLLLEPSYRRFLDFQIISDDNEYWLVWCQLITRIETFRNYLRKYSNVVDEIHYGIELWGIIPKIAFPENNMDVRFINYTFDK